LSFLEAIFWYILLALADALGFDLDM